MKFYILTSEWLIGLSRLVNVLPKTKTVVVINSLDKEYIDTAVSFCVEHGIVHHVTRSDGTPGTGKNSVIDLFLESDEDYIVPIDGDDYITPHGIGFYERMAERGTVDCCVLYRQEARKISEHGTHYVKYYPFDRSSPEFANNTIEGILPYYTENQRAPDMETAMRWTLDRMEFNDLMYAHSEARESLCRITFLSRRAAELIHYDNTIMVGEDQLQYLQLKKIALDSKSISMVRHREKSNPTYIYMNDKPSKRFIVGTRDWNWMRPFIERVKAMYPLAANTHLPEYIDDVN